jgi:hypothetical protein
MLARRADPTVPLILFTANRSILRPDNGGSSARVWYFVNSNGCGVCGNNTSTDLRGSDGIVNSDGCGVSVTHGGDFPLPIWRDSKKRVCPAIVIPSSDSANLDAVVAHTCGDETVRGAVSVFIDRVGTLIEQGGPMALLLSRQKTFWPQLTTAPAHTGPVQTKKCKTTQRRAP